ncbi:MAG TPA: putative 2OG-Fe(II) oxygenase [Stellaceae bacterium]|nr:putative 2OG-Fe(II) oxygenase [Stellaceae bacterium]
MQWEPFLSSEQLRVAAELARAGTRSDPTRPGSWLVLSHTLAKLGKFDEAIACLDAAIDRLPPTAELHLRLGEMLRAQNRLEEALPQAERALAIAPGEPRATQLYLDLLALLGRYEKLDRDALAVFAAKSAHLMNLHTRSLGPAKTIEMCDSLLAENPGHVTARFWKAVSLAQLGRAEEARRLISIERLVEMRELPAPSGYADSGSFQAALACEIQANPTLGGDQKGKSSREGLQTRVLRQPGAGAVDALLSQFQQAVDAYEARLVAAGDEFASTRPRRARLDAWAMVCGATSRQVSHVHSSGWLSGVYYVAAPRPNGANAYRGPLVMGGGVAEPPWGTREIEPVPGRLVLFPSYVPHQALPTGVDGARISVAFDVVDAA